jgi:beta-glucosidase/6-phospho-beta-glucosidase/beta-galactosidase
MPLTRDSLDSLLGADSFAWLAGIEDTFSTAPSPRTGRTLDEYELTDHYAQLETDLDLFAALGLRQVRHGLPWHRLNPRPGHWDFDWADRAIDGLLSRGIDPVVDLVHYGLPAWIDGAFLHPDYPQYVAEYAGRVAERYRGRVHAYTPLNEPRVTAWYCGRLGWWPPYQRSWRGFVRVLLAACRGIAATVARLREVDPRIVTLHVDATDLYETREPALAPEVERRQALVFLALDLLAGRVRADHPLFGWLLQQGAMPDELDAFVAAREEPDLVGINLYPLFSDKRLETRGGRLRIRMPYASADIVERLAALYWARCRRPLLISETASSGSVARRLQWLEDSVRATARVRARGIPLVGYTWWPLFALVTWGYREGRLPPARYLRQMGLWDLVEQDDALRRVATPLVARYRELVEGGARAVGRLASPETP